MAEEENAHAADIEVLTEDALLQVFTWLCNSDLLLSARRVCRRWRALAVAPELWRPRTLHCCRPSTAVGLRVLTCARSLSVWEDDHKTDNYREFRYVLALMSDTNCGLEELRYKSGSSQRDVARNAIRAVQRQGALGRLRELTVEAYTQLNQAMYRAIDCAALETLRFEVSSFDWLVRDFPEPVTFRQRQRQCAPKELSFSYNPRTEMLVEELLLTHCDSVERVFFQFDCAISDRPGAERALQLLSLCSRLQEADVPLTAELGALLRGCTELRTLKLTVSERVDSALEEIKQAVKLSSLSIRCRDGDAVALDIVGALASSGLSGLQELCLPRVRDCSEVGAALRGLPQLHTLSLAESSPELLAVLTPSNAPNLRRLKFPYMYFDDGPKKCCQLSELPQLCDVVRRIRGLHVLDIRLSMRLCDNVESCCLSIAPVGGSLSGRVEKLHLFEHNPAESCDLKEHCQGTWTHVEVKRPSDTELLCFAQLFFENNARYFSINF